MPSPRVRQILHRIRRFRHEQPDGVLLEGPHLLEAALDAGVQLEALFVANEYWTKADRASLLERVSCPIEILPEEALARVGDADSPRGLLALGHVHRASGADLLARAATLRREGGMPWVYLDTLQDPGNLGAIARAAEAFGAPGLLLSPGCVHPNHPRALRGSAGSLLRLPVGLGTTLDDLRTALASTGPWAGLLARGGGSIEPAEPRPCLLAAGSEGQGLRPEVEAHLDVRWTIPLRPPVESLNVAVAVGVCLYALSELPRPSRNLRTTSGTIS